MPTPLTLTTAPLEHLAMDYAFLRQEGLRHLERLAGPLWTDFNAHDPGITILEQLCYALTDLAYRINYELPDLLSRANEDPYDSLHSPGQILTSDPVTLIDLRKLVLDVTGVKNAWIEKVEEQQPPLYFTDEGERQLSVTTQPDSADPVALKGLYRVLIEKPDDIDGPMVQRAVARRLHAHRNLCEDFEEIRILNPQPVTVHARIEIGQLDDAEDLLVTIYQRIAEYLSPSIRYYTLHQRLAAGKRIDEIFEGPWLEHGFLDTKELRQAQRRTAVRASDLIREIMAVPGVRVVRTMSIVTDTKSEPWSLDVDLDKTPTLDLDNSQIDLERNQLRVGVNVEKVKKSYYQRFRNATNFQPLALEERDLQPPRGRDRNVGHYHSIQYQFPAVYGIGELGLPDSASPQRKAQAKQLTAYLMFFDQLLANYFAQLAHIKELFSFHETSAEKNKWATYFSQMLRDSSLGLDKILLDNFSQDALQSMTEDPYADAKPQAPEGSPELRRKHRFLNHLLALFAEQFTDYSLMLAGNMPSGDNSEKLAQDKQKFLQDYPQLSSTRGTGFSYVEPWSDSNRSRLENRIRRKLKMTGWQEECYVVEHILLRPMGEDTQQQAPLLADALRKDLYSLQLSVVFPAWPQCAEFRQYVEKVVHEETPAHLMVYIHWLYEEPMSSFVATYKDWVNKRCEYWKEPLGVLAQEQVAMAITHIHVRDARDRLIDLLGIGQTYPLRDLAVQDEQLVAFNTSAKIYIEPSQMGVLYQLFKNDQLVKHPDGVPAEVEGNGEGAIIVTPPIQEDVTYTIYAKKLLTGRDTYLRETATVKVGLDVTLQACILDADRLVPVSENPSSAAPRIIQYGGTVKVKLKKSQEGVDYHLVTIRDVGPGKAPEEIRLSNNDVGGDLGDITLQSEAILEDIDIRIRATKTFDPSENRPPQTVLLDVVLPLKVRANPALFVSVEPVIVDFNQQTTITVANTQRSVRYQLYIRKILDRDFDRTVASAAEVVKVSVAGKPDVQVPKPLLDETWSTPNGYSAVGEGQPGSGGDLRLPIGEVTEDLVVIVQARKEHQAAAVVPSAVPLEQAVVILVRPNPTPALKLQASPTAGTVHASGGQPGVFYYFRVDPDGPDLTAPVYFHQREDEDQRVNKGIGQLAVEIDFVITPAWSPEKLANSVDLAQTPPELPVLEARGLDSGAVLHVRAVKAQTGVAVELPQTVNVEPPATT